jgi:hypothetical protein
VPHFEAHWLDEQTCPAAQAAPQAPQLAGSLVVSTQAPAQSWKPACEQEHLPPWHSSSWLQAFPHWPQLETSVLGSRQTPLQSRSPGPQTHWLPEQPCPAPQA